MISKFSIKPEIDNKPNRRGEHGIFIRVTHRRQRLRFFVGHKVAHKFWDPNRGQVKQGHPLSSMINQILKSQELEIQKFITGKQASGITIGLEHVKAAFGENGGSELNVIRSYALKLIEDMRGKFSSGTLTIYDYESRRIESYAPGVTFEQIDPRWLKNYESHLRSLQLKPNCIHKSFKVLTKFFNSARRDGVTGNDPFAMFDKPRYVQGDRTYLTEQEVEAWSETLSIPMDARMRRAATWFLFGCYSGLRFSDWQRFEIKRMVRKDDIIIRAKKNGQLVVLPLFPGLRKILKLLPEVGPVEAEHHTNRLLKGYGTLCKIEKNVHCHVSRHTFGTRCMELGLSLETTAEFMGISVKTCQIYAKVTGVKLRKEAEKLSGWG